MKYIIFIILICAISFTDSVIFGQNNPDEENLRKAALSFYDWYVKGIYSDSIVINGFLVKGENGKCRLNTVEYFNGLKALGTISQKFLNSEKERFSGCANFLSKASWEDYKNADDPYYFDDSCPMLSSYWWIHSQEPISGAEIKSLKVLDNSHAIAEIIFYDNDENNKIYINDIFPLIFLEREDIYWKITAIKVRLAGQL